MIRRLRAWWRRRRFVDSGEVCRTCLQDIDARDCYERVEHLDNLAEMGTEGGTFLTAYWCRQHAPADATPWKGP